MEFRHVEEHLAHALDRAEAMGERLAGVLHNYHACLAERTNQIVRVLTVFAAVLLPLTLIAGIYGMNVPVWPPGENPASFWTIMLGMVVVAGGLLLYFKKRKWV